MQSNFNLSTNPHSLEYPRFPAPAIPDEKPGIFRGVMLWLGGYYTKESTLMRGAEGLWDSVTEASTNPKLFETFDIPTDFQHEHAVLCLHVWLILVRLRPEGKSAKELAQILYDNFQDDLEKKVRAAGVKVKVRGQLAELEKQFYGSCMAYDNAIKGEGTDSLAGAFLRNIYQGAADKENASLRLERYAQRELACLSQTDSKAVLGGNVKFSFVGETKC